MKRLNCYTCDGCQVVISVIGIHIVSKKGRDLHYCSNACFEANNGEAKKKASDERG